MQNYPDIDWEVLPKHFLTFVKTILILIEKFYLITLKLHLTQKELVLLFNQIVNNIQYSSKWFQCGVGKYIYM